MCLLHFGLQILQYISHTWAVSTTLMFNLKRKPHLKMKAFTLKCSDMRWNTCVFELKTDLALFDLICIHHVYSISSKSMRSKSRKGLTCCRTSSSTSTHSASKTKSVNLNLRNILSYSTVSDSYLLQKSYLNSFCVHADLFCNFSVMMCSNHVSFACFLFSFFQDGLKAVDNLKPSIEKLATDLHTVRKPAALLFIFSPFHILHFYYIGSIYLFIVSFLNFPLRQIKQVQDEERKQLTQLRDVLKSALQVEQKEVTHTHTHSLLKVFSYFLISNNVSRILNLLILTWWVLI